MTPAPGPSGPAPTGRRLAQLAELPVSVLRGVGPRAAADLEALGIASVLDLLTQYPRRHVDATRLVPPGALAVGEPAAMLATVRSARRPPGRAPRGRRAPIRVELEVGDASGTVRVVFFNQAWRARQLPAGTTALFFGKPSEYGGRLQLVNPTVEVVRTAGDEAEGDDDGAAAGRIYAVYPLSEAVRLTSVQVSRFVGEALDRAGTFADPLDPVWRQRIGLVGRTEAFTGIHRPRRMSDREPARRRLAFDELFRLQLALVLRQARLARDARGIRHVIQRPDGAPTLADRFLAGLPFALTAGQRGALADIRADLAGPRPMHRLLQGDVGAGKTVVAVATLLSAVEGGHQGAFMAPTEVLAEQHRLGIDALLDGLERPDPSARGADRPVSVALLTSRTGAAARRRIRDGLADGSVDLVVGTHALLTDDVRFASLGAVVIDEQHRFGVEQRAALRAKGRGAD
nr:DEAD/DEAH box helicase [Actinomycetota bacterium]